MEYIKDYEITQPFSSYNAGTCTWGQCRKDGHLYFIKKFLSPRYPSDSANLSQDTISRKKARCDAFYRKKCALYQALARCDYGNIVYCTDFFRWGSAFYAVSEWVDFKSCDANIIQNLPLDQKMTFLKAVLYSFSKIHRTRIVHADIKPENILLVPTVEGYYTGKIIDFDSGYFVGNSPDEVQGDPLYMAPESFRKLNGEDVYLTQKVDVFALGLLIHNYLTGKLPEIPADYNYVFEAVLDGHIPELSVTIPLDVRVIIGRMLLTDPEKRPTAEEVLAYLKKVMPCGEEAPIFTVCGDI